jgi:Domain of unknown function (DUF397)
MEYKVTTWEELEASGWRKASFSSGNGGNCVMTKRIGAGMAVGDTKDPDGAKLAFPASAWETFTTALKKC